MRSIISALACWITARKVILLLLLILALGSFLRFYDLGAESIWYDEASSINLCIQNLSTIIQDCALTQNHPPLYFGLLHYWIKLFGTSEVATRSLSVVFGILSVGSIYKIGTALYNQKVGLLAGLISAMSFFHIAYSQEVRGYSLLLLLSLLSYYTFIKILQDNKKRWYPAYFASSVLLGYTHFYGLYIIVSQVFLFALMWNRYREQRTRILVVLGTITVALLPLVFLLGGRVTHFVKAGFWIPEPGLVDIARTLVAFSAYWGTEIPKLIVIAFVPLVIIALFSIKETGGKWSWQAPLTSVENSRWNVSFDRLEAGLLLLVWLFMPIFVAFIQSKLMTPTYQVRYLIGASPALFLLVAKGLGNLSKKWLFYPALVFVVLLFSIGLYSYYVDEFKFPWRNVSSFIENNSRENDIIILNSPTAEEPFYYYFRGSAEVHSIPWQAQQAQEKWPLIKDIGRDKDRLWLITNSSDTESAIYYLNELYGSEVIVKEESFNKASVLMVDLPNNTGEN